VDESSQERKISGMKCSQVQELWLWDMKIPGSEKSQNLSCSDLLWSKGVLKMYCNIVIVNYYILDMHNITWHDITP